MSLLPMTDQDNDAQRQGARALRATALTRSFIEQVMRDHELAPDMVERIRQVEADVASKNPDATLNDITEAMPEDVVLYGKRRTSRILWDVVRGTTEDDRASTYTDLTSLQGALEAIIKSYQLAASIMTAWPNIQTEEEFWEKSRYMQTPAGRREAAEKTLEKAELPADLVSLIRKKLLDHDPDDQSNLL